jgi:hypothetical protein
MQPFHRGPVLQPNASHAACCRSRRDESSCRQLILDHAQAPSKWQQRRCGAAAGTVDLVPCRQAWLVKLYVGIFLESLLHQLTQPDDRRVVVEARMPMLVQRKGG